MEPAMSRDVALVSVSIDLGAGRRGVDMGPSALSIAGITPAIESLGHVVREIGTVTAGGFILFGLWTRPVAFLLAGEMTVAYFQAHFPRDWVPIVNRGELAVLYCWVFLFIAANGGGSFSLDGFLAARRAAKSGG